MIQLKEITKENYRACMNLKTTKEQEDFVAPNWYSMLEAIYEEPRQAFALYNGEDMVGFLLFSFYEADEDYPKASWWIERFMIAEKFQNQGLGSQAFLAGLDWFKTHIQAQELRISAVNGNEIATKLYERNGFVLTGEMIDNEHVLLLQLPTDQG